MASGRTSTPTFINLPPPPAEPVTPSDVPGTPTSTTTSMSELSTVAIKDGHRGHLHHHHRDIHNLTPHSANSPSAVNAMDAERADRISRLAGLDRLAGGPGGQGNRNVASSMSGVSTAPPSVLPTHAYFDANSIPQIVRERSTVGSASATTGSVHEGDGISRTERTGTSAWATSDGGDFGSRDGDMERDNDGLSEDMDMEVEANSSVGGFSDEGVNIGGGAAGSPTAAVRTAVPIGAKDLKDAKMIDGITYDRDVLDTVGRTPPVAED